MCSSSSLPPLADGIADVATVLHTNTTVTELNIGGCSMSDEGADSLARALAVNRSLQELQISNSKISDNGIASIATALQTNTVGSVRGVRLFCYYSAQNTFHKEAPPLCLFKRFCCVILNLAGKPP